MLTGQAKKDYQREYMRNHRSNKKPLDPVRPDVRPDVRPTLQHDVPLVPKDNPQVIGQKPVFSTDVRYRANGVPYHPVIGWE